MEEPHTNIGPRLDPGSYGIRIQAPVPRPSRPLASARARAGLPQRQEVNLATHSIHLADPDPHPVAKPSRRRGDGPRLVSAALAAAVLVAAVLILGPAGLIPFGLLLVLSTDPDDDNGRRSVILTRRNLGIAAVMALALAWLWLWHVDLTESMLVLIGGALIALPLALQDPAGHAAARRTVAITKRSLVLALWGLVVFVNLTYAYGQSWNMLAAVCLVLPLVLAVTRAWNARRGRLELGLLRHPQRRELRPHLVQALNIWLCCALLAGVVAAGGTHYARIGFSLDGAEFNALLATFAAGLALLAALALRPADASTWPPTRSWHCCRPTSRGSSPRPPARARTPSYSTPH